MEQKLRLATISLFIRALIDELETKHLKSDYVIKICNRSKKYVNKSFKTKEEKALLDKVANESWDMACNVGEIKTIAIAPTVLKLFDSAYRDELEKKVGFNPKHFEKLYNAFIDSSTLSIKIASRDVANESIKIINKVIYNTLKE